MNKIVTCFFVYCQNGYKYMNPTDILPGINLHCLVDSFLLPQWISSWHASDASEIVVHSGSHPVIQSNPLIQAVWDLRVTEKYP